MIAAALAAAAAAFALGGHCDQTLCNAGTLQPYFAKLARAKGRSGPPVHILQIGDSHTAGDAISGAWRDLLQARYGSGGRGVLAPGRPYAGYLTQGVTVSMSPDWAVYADFGRDYSETHPPIGLSGFSLTSKVPGASMSLVADGGERFDRLVVCAIAEPGAGTLVLHLGSETDRMKLSAVTAGPRCKTMRSDQPVTDAGLSTEDGPVTLTSWATFEDQGGVALSNLGVVGSQLVHFSRTDDAVIAEELRAYKPDLIVIAFGTNEGFAPRWSEFEYEVVLRSQIGRIRRLAGNVPILLLGAPDALTRREELRTNAAGESSADCGAPTLAPITTADATPATASGIGGAMARIGSALGFGAAAAQTPDGSDAPPSPAPQPAPLATGTSRGPLFPPAALAQIRAVQRRVAASLHVAFWDWQARMGGRCTADAWVHMNPPLMRGDYVHYTSAGGHEIADRLEADLDQAETR